MNKKNKDKFGKNEEKNNIKNVGASILEERLNNITEGMFSSNYFARLKLLNNNFNNIIPNNYIDIIPKNLLYIKDVLPQNNIKVMSEMLLQKNYMTNILLKNNINIITEGVSSQMYLANAIKNIIPQNYISNLLNSVTNINIYYRDTVKICIDEILNSNINLNNILINDELNINTIEVEDIENFNEKDKTETISNVKEIIEIVRNKKNNSEQLIYNKLNSLKESHPIIATVIHEVFWILVSIVIGSIFTQNANQYYIQNYSINNNIVIEEVNQDFIDNARYVIAEKLNVRSGPSKEYNILTTLEYGTVVKIMEKINYWTKIQYKDVDNDIILEGWVYTRYLDKFDIELLKN